MVHSHHTVLNADETGRYTTSQDLKKESGEWEKGQMLPGPEKQFNGFLEAAPDAVVIADQNGRIIRVNAQAEKLFGYSRREMLGREVEMLMPKRFQRGHVGQRTAYSAHPSPRPMGTGQQLYGLRKDGHEFPAEISLSHLSVEDGIVIASVIRDVTEHRRMEEELRLRTRELEDAARHKDEFLGMVAHELRNPLGTIRNAVQVLKQLTPVSIGPEMSSAARETTWPTWLRTCWTPPGLPTGRSTSRKSQSNWARSYAKPLRPVSTY